MSSLTALSFLKIAISVGCAYTFNDKYLSELVVCTEFGSVSTFPPSDLRAIAFTFAIPGELISDKACFVGVPNLIVVDGVPRDSFNAFDLL